MNNQNSSSLAASQTSNLIQVPAWQNVLKYSLIIGLFFIGFLVELSPKWPTEAIHIPVSPGHGFTTQDTVASIPISLALILLLSAVWKYRPMMKQRIQASPVNAFGLALIIGLSTGIILGIALGMIFKIPLVILLKEVLKPVQTLFFG